MTKLYFKVTLELLGLQVFFSVMTFFFMEFFSWLGDSIWVFNLLTGWLLLGAIHSTFWQMGRKDAKNNKIINNHLTEGQHEVRLSLLGGLKRGSLFFALNILLVVATCLFNDSGVLFTIHRIMLGSLCGFLPGNVNLYYWLISCALCVVMYIPCIVAYITGAYNFSLSEKIVPKLVYKSRK